MTVLISQRRSEIIKRIAFASFIGIIAILLAAELFANFLNSDRSVVLPPAGPSDLSQLTIRNRILRRRIDALAPEGIYIVIDTAQNLLFLKQGSRTILKAVVSSGSGSILRDPAGNRQWVFDTPRGESSVKAKIAGPKWIRPDWAFIEEEQDIPKNWQDRVQEGVLGDYALGFGNGYFIHGTLYKRLLGRNVTHGCVRVGDQDLEIIYRRSQIGTKIYIF